MVHVPQEGLYPSIPPQQPCVVDNGNSQGLDYNPLPTLYNPDWSTTKQGHIFNDLVQNLIEIATELISNTTSSSSSSSRSAAPFGGISYTDNSWNWGSNNTRVIHSGRRDDRKEEDRRGLYLVVGFVGMIVATVFAYKAGKSAPKQMEASDTVSELRAISNSIQLEHETPHKVKVVSLIDHTTKLAKAKQKSANWDLALKVSLFVSGVALFSGASMAYVGGIAAIQIGQNLMTAGLVTGFVATCGLVFKSGVESHKNRKIERTIQSDIAQINSLKHPYEWEEIHNPDGTTTWELVLKTPPPAPNFPQVNPAVAAAAATAPSAPPYGE